MDRLRTAIRIDVHPFSDYNEKFVFVKPRYETNEQRREYLKYLINSCQLGKFIRAEFSCIRLRDFNDKLHKLIPPLLFIDLCYLFRRQVPLIPVASRLH
ncbi:hypothetical protein C0J52_25755 [Blattella germanica]|nr:hypothetical protein C0J52_25755 [Blattella germanica]